ncbi:hypothetical protein JM18_003048 [Phytophthora kernoviae]|uniref:Uncharacterized protein n=1 Tax=Phytophthora kernoviae TaxID=325452 RepID=A0A8T0M331_9STRA|nr:hypothetical protein JM16_002366 [Phytophthora kernoviae]KAG2528501.1 hypothetical protein JM18_003048 [Phytophthora kernoviae]
MASQHPYIAGPQTPKVRPTQDDPLPFRSQENPIRTASLLSMVTMAWLQPLISLGAKRALEREDVWAMSPEDTCKVLRERFDKELDTVNSSAQPPPFGIPRVAIALVKTFRQEIAVVFASDLVFIAGSALLSFFVEAILDYLNDRSNLFGIKSGYVLVVLLSLVALIAMMCFNFAWFISSRVGVNMRSLLLDAVYRKSLLLSSKARQKYTSGEIMTLVSVDIDRVFNGMMNGPWVFLAPVGFTVTVVLIGVLFDPLAALADLLLLIVVLAISFSLAKRIGTARRELLPVTEERLRVTSEALQGIRVTKFYAWNESVATRVESIRREEVRRYRRFHFLQILNSALLFLTPTFLAGVTVGVYVIYQGSFSVIQAFTLVAVINVSRQGVNAFPLGIADLSQTAVACHRIDEFLASDELEAADSGDVSNQSRVLRNGIEFESSPRGTITVENAQFCWSTSNASLNHHSGETSNYDVSATKCFTLQGINLHIDAGSLVMVVGAVGSGKSSLLQALLGEMQGTGGNMAVRGDISYVSQEAWIRNATLRDNIVFESEYNSEHYDKVLEAAQLAPDLAVLPSGDRTEIGERGINLSGGQKARVSVARALYNKSSDILMLDDPLSAVDPHVAHAIFDRCILGVAKDKTRVLVVNSHYDLLSHADKIVLLQQGHIAGEGNYADMIARFPELYSQGKSNMDSDAESEQMQQLLTQKEDRVKGRVTGHVYKTYLDETGFNAFVVVLIVIVGYAVMRDVDRTDNAMTSVERILHFREIPQEEDASDCLSIDSAVWPSQGAVVFENLCLKYRPELPLVLNGVNMNIVGGEKVGICGRTGAGKSSLMIALFRICEFDSGTIRIDGIDIQKLKLHDLRRSLAIIPQDPVLFSGPLRDNLDPFGEYSDADIWGVLKQVHLADAVASWGSGLQFVISEKGENLSVGQRQLLCIGRALLKHSKIVVLDEATANVDTVTDQLIQKTIRETFKDQTVLIIAHRINTIMHCDKIAVMEAGQVAEFGGPVELLVRSDSAFAALAKRSGQC